MSTITLKAVPIKRLEVDTRRAKDGDRLHVQLSDQTSLTLTVRVTNGKVSYYVAKADLPAGYLRYMAEVTARSEQRRPQCLITLTDETYVSRWQVDEQPILRPHTPGSVSDMLIDDWVVPATVVSFWDA